MNDLTVFDSVHSCPSLLFRNIFNMCECVCVCVCLVAYVYMNIDTAVLLLNYLSW